MRKEYKILIIKLRVPDLLKVLKIRAIQLLKIRCHDRFFFYFFFKPHNILKIMSSHGLFCPPNSSKPPKILRFHLQTTKATNSHV